MSAFPSLFVVAVFFLILFVATAVRAETPSFCPFSWNSNLKAGSSGNDVLRLQQFLNSDADTTIALSGVGSSGAETTTFGSLTKNAVIKFQNKYSAEILAPNGLSSGTGIVGVSTRAKLNALCGASAATQPLVVEIQTASAAGSVMSSALVVAEGDQPVSSLAPQAALYVPFTRFTLTARGGEDVVVRSVAIARTGPSHDNAFDYLSLLDEDGNELSYAYLRSDHKAIFKDEFIVPAGQVMTLTVAGNMVWDLSERAGEAAILQVEAIDASAPVEGTLPIRGSMQTMNSSLAIGTATATLSPSDPNGARTMYVNDTGVIFSGVKVAVGPEENLRLYSVTWRQSGSAAPADLANVTVSVDGVTYGTEVDGRDYTATFPDGIVIKKGYSADVVIKGDITTSGSNRTVQFDIDGAAYVYLVGESYGYGIYTIPGGNTDVSGNSLFLTEDGTTDTDSITPFFSGSIVTISPGAFISVGK